MKKISYIIILAIIVMTSCTKVLDLVPYQSIDPEEAIKNKSGVERAISGAYNTLQSVGSYGRYQVIVSDLAADNLDWVATSVDYSEIANNQITANNTIIDGIWTSNYDGINRANNILYKLPSISGMDESEKDAYEGQALFLRGLFHFNLVNFFGGVPIKIKPTLDLNDINQARNTRDEVLQQVISDLEAAELKLPEIAPAGQANTYTASALLARVYLTRFQMSNMSELAAKAIEKADRVITEGGYTLAGSYADLFNGNQSEVIFQVVFDAQNYNRLAQNFFPVSLSGLYIIAPSPGFMTSYDTVDSVRFINSARVDADNKPYCFKYRDIVTGTDRVMVLRLAEMYLIKAEALAYSDGLVADIQENLNVVRTRAGLADTEANTLPLLKLAIENERRHEFAFECQRWQDLVRTGRATELLGIEDKYTVFPIPLSEMQTNKKMTQNEGY